MQLESQKHGLACGIFSAMLFACMTISIQQISPSIPASEISFFRGTFTVFGLLPFVWKNISTIFDVKDSRAVWLRSLFGAVAVLCYFWNTTHGSAAEAKALANTNPMYVAFFSWILFKERLNRNEICGLVILSFGAWLLVIEMQKSGSFQNWIIGNVGAVFTGAAYLSLKKASTRFKPNLIVFTFGVCVMIVSFLGPGTWLIPESRDFIWLLLVCLTGLFGQTLLTASYIHLKNTTASALTLLNSLFLITYDLLFTKRLDSISEIIGNVLILMGMSLMIKKYTKREGSISVLQSPEQKKIY